MKSKTFLQCAIADLKLEHLVVELLRHAITRSNHARKDTSEMRYQVYCSLLDKKSWYDISKDINRSSTMISAMKRQTERELKRTLTIGHEARKRSRHAAKYLIEVLDSGDIK